MRRRPLIVGVLIVGASVAALSDAVGRVEFVSTATPDSVSYELEVHPDLIRTIVGDD